MLSISSHLSPFLAIQPLLVESLPKSFCKRIKVNIFDRHFKGGVPVAAATFGLTGINPIGNLVTDALEAAPFHKGLKADKWDGRVSESQFELIRLTTLPKIWLARHGTLTQGKIKNRMLLVRNLRLSFLILASRADKVITRSTLPGCRTKQKAG
jgi:hypothetical protein